MLMLEDGPRTEERTCWWKQDIESVEKIFLLR